MTFPDRTLEHAANRWLVSSEFDEEVESWTGPVPVVVERASS